MQNCRMASAASAASAHNTRSRFGICYYIRVELQEGCQREGVRGGCEFSEMNTKKSGKMQTGMEIGVCQGIPWMNDAQRLAAAPVVVAAGCSGVQLAAWCWWALSVHTRR